MIDSELYSLILECRAFVADARNGAFEIAKTSSGVVGSTKREDAVAAMAALAVRDADALLARIDARINRDLPAS